jgi:3-deoxy-D-manno-octulosonic acid kinase
MVLQEIRSYQGYRIGAAVAANDVMLQRLVALFGSRNKNSTQPLNGRGNVIYGDLPSIGRVVVKRYLRGGVFRHFIHSKYFRYGPTRGEREYRLLQVAHEVGINVPDPLFFADRGWPLYEAWLVTREIEGRINFADLAKTDEHAAIEYVDALVEQITLLVQEKIFHVDLHPGNVVMDQNRKVYILDFDKAEEYTGRKNTLRDLYLVRWRRAVIKHRLPEWVSEAICPALRKNFED